MWSRESRTWLSRHSPLARCSSTKLRSEWSYRSPRPENTETPRVDPTYRSRGRSARGVYARLLAARRNPQNLRPSHCLPGEHENQIARCQDCVEDVPREKPGKRRKTEPLGAISGIIGRLPAGRTLGVDQRHGRPFAHFSLVKPLFLDRVALRNAGIERDLANSQVII